MSSARDNVHLHHAGCQSGLSFPLCQSVTISGQALTGRDRLRCVRERHPVKAILRARGIRQDWFAQQVGLEQSRLSKILSFDRPEPPGFRSAAARILGVPEEWLRPAEPKGEAA